MSHAVLPSSPFRSPCSVLLAHLSPSLPELALPTWLGGPGGRPTPPATGSTVLFPHFLLQRRISTFPSLHLQYPLPQMGSSPPTIPACCKKMMIWGGGTISQPRSFTLQGPRLDPQHRRTALDPHRCTTILSCLGYRRHILLFSYAPDLKLSSRRHYQPRLLVSPQPLLLPPPLVLSPRSLPPAFPYPPPPFSPPSPSLNGSSSHSFELHGRIAGVSPLKAFGQHARPGCFPRLGTIRRGCFPGHTAFHHFTRHSLMGAVERRCMVHEVWGMGSTWRVASQTLFLPSSGLLRLLSQTAFIDSPLIIDHRLAVSLPLQLSFSPVGPVAGTCKRRGF